jgi:hypothetical protein
MTVLAAVGRMRRELEWEMPAHVVFSARTVRGLAAHSLEPTEAEDSELRQRLARRAALIRKAQPHSRRAERDIR